MTWLTRLASGLVGGALGGLAFRYVAGYTFDLAMTISIVIGATIGPLFYFITLPIVWILSGACGGFLGGSISGALPLLLLGYQPKDYQRWALVWTKMGSFIWTSVNAIGFFVITNPLLVKPLYLVWSFIGLMGAIILIFVIEEPFTK